jgi:hypothetical protein
VAAERRGATAAGWVALAIGIVVVASIASLVTFYIVGGPFGAINDAGNGLIGVLSAALAILLRRQRAGSGLGVIAAVIGAAVGVWGSWLIISGTTGFVLAGFVSTIGFGLIGAWLSTVVWSPTTGERWIGYRWIGRLAALVMVVGGIAAIPSALMGIDDDAAMPPWLWLFSLAWIGAYVLYPVWSVSLGRRLVGRLSGRQRRPGRL